MLSFFLYTFCYKFITLFIIEIITCDNIVSEGKRKQLFNHLLNEFRNSKVSLGASPGGGLPNASGLNSSHQTPHYLSGTGPAQLGLSMNGGANGYVMHNSQISGSAPSSTVKHSKKKSTTIDKNKSFGPNNNSSIIQASNQAIQGGHVSAFNAGMNNTGYNTTVSDLSKKTPIPKKSKSLFFSNQFLNKEAKPKGRCIKR